MSIIEQNRQCNNYKLGSRSGVNMADTENFSQFFLTTEAGLYAKSKLFRVVHG